MSYDFDQFRGGPNPDHITYPSHFDIDDIGDGSKAYHGILREIAQRASDSHRHVSLGLWGPREEPLLEVSFPAGETIRDLCIDHTNCELFADIPFGEYEFLTRYNAIWNKHSDIIEVALKCVGNCPLDPDHVVTDESSGAKLRLRLSSKAAQGLLGRGSHMLTLTLAGARIRSVDEAHAILESIGTAFLFQAGLADGCLYSLVEIRSRAERPELYTRRHKTYRWGKDLSFPQRRLEAEPLALYYYAGELSDEFPLLKFLAYYQVLEYFFARYSSLDVVESVSSMLLQSGFKSHDIGLVRKIVDHVLARAGRRYGFGAERDQLLATVTKCVDPGGLRELLDEHDHDRIALGKYLTDRRRLKGVAIVKLSPGRDNAPLLRSLSNRIYDIRNRIVHAKQNSTDDGQEPLFPFSKESMALQPDIEVLRYVAASVLIESAISIT